MTITQWLRLLLATHVVHCMRMFSKRALPEDRDETAPEKRLRTNLADLFLSNHVSGARSQSLFNDAADAKAMHVADLASATCAPQNASRRLRRKLMKGRLWPKPYYAQIRLWSPRLQRETYQTVALLLPHEMLATLSYYNEADRMRQQTAMAEAAKTKLAELQRQFAIPGLLGLGLWGDGVPVNYDRSESLEVLSWNLPGLPKLRVPITAVSKKFWVKHHTADDLMAIAQWSLDHCLLGTYPRSRHDGKNWGPTDHKRRKLAGKALGFQAVCVECRADWAWYQSVLRFPQWSENEGCCYKCWAKKDNLREVGDNAPWRQQPLSHTDMWLRWQKKAQGVCPLFASPGVTIDTCVVDWLHVMDLGVAAVFWANLFYMVCPKLHGNSFAEQCKTLFALMCQYYVRENVQDRCQTMVPTMIKQAKKGPKLRGKAAEVRNLVKFGIELSETFLDDSNIMESSAKEAARLLSTLYSNLSREKFSAQQMKDTARRFALLHVALESHSANKHLWHVFPKLHMMLHLCESGCCPADAWTYRDEDFGGAIGHLSKRRGGKNSALSTSNRILLS